MLSEEHQRALAEAKGKLRAYLSQAIDWFRARRVYDSEVLAFIDLDAELLLRLHREDMRVVRNVSVGQELLWDYGEDYLARSTLCHRG